ncbi:hypothetical protein CEXT_279321 [Caerostris extrusa]|uniref:Uncharacterized protein n=1 Tax=Caerostris extrusa TaxID=172846 RepID=A0AAV4XU90_CAEEX|nr:hypothetical protein CEXT_279321 [Caerostris extrusa]
MSYERMMQQRLQGRLELAKELQSLRKSRIDRSRTFSSCVCVNYYCVHKAKNYTHVLQSTEKSRAIASALSGAGNRGVPFQSGVATDGW